MPNLSPGFATWRLLFGIVACVAFLVVVMRGTLREIPLQAASAKWPTTAATIIQCEVRKRRAKLDDLLFRCHYAVGGRSYEASQRRIVTMTAYDLFENPADFAANHPVGSTLSVWYDPADPSAVTIAPGLSAWDLAGPAVLFLVAGVGALMMLAEVIRRTRRRAPQSDRQPFGLGT